MPSGPAAELRTLPQTPGESSHPYHAVDAAAGPMIANAIRRILPCHVLQHHKRTPGDPRFRARLARYEGQPPADSRRLSRLLRANRRRVGSVFHLSHLGERRVVGSDQLRNRCHLGISLSGRRPDGLFGRSCSAAASKEKATECHNAAAVTRSMNQRRSLALSLAFGLSAPFYEPLHVDAKPRRAWILLADELLLPRPTAPIVRVGAGGCVGHPLRIGD